jgi:hypothetical protein
MANFRRRDDLRHTWPGWLSQNGTPLRDLQKMGGWKTAPICGSTRIRRRHTQMAYHAAVVDGPLRVTSTIQPVEEGARQKQKRRHDHS